MVCRMLQRRSIGLLNAELPGSKGLVSVELSESIFLGRLSYNRKPQVRELAIILATNCAIAACG